MTTSLVGLLACSAAPGDERSNGYGAIVLPESTSDGTRLARDMGQERAAVEPASAAERRSDDEGSKPRRGARVPTVLQRKPGPPPPYDKDIVRRIVRSHINDIRACYHKGLAADPGLKGRVEVEFRIDARGKVEHARVKEQSLPDTSVSACIVSAVQRWTFPEPYGGSATIVYPFVLEPE